MTSSLVEYFEIVEEATREAGNRLKGASHASLCGMVLDRGRAFESTPLTDAEVGWLFKLIDDHPEELRPVEANDG